MPRPYEFFTKFAVASLFILIAALSPVVADDSRPNVIFVMCDDLGYGDLGCYGQKVIRTPHLDQMAKEGMRFTDFYCGNTVCRPSRLVLWTGQHAGHTAINSNTAYVLKPGDVTVAQLLKKSGYQTGGVGKWALGNTENSGHPNRKGFEFWFGYLDQSAAHNYYPEFLWRNGEKVPLAGNKVGDQRRVSVVRKTYSHDLMTDEAFGFIRRSAATDNPFLLHVHWTIPHANNEGGRATGDGMEVPDHGDYADQDWPKPEKGQAAMISRMDRDMGRMFELLKELKIDQNTLVIFTSDNGPHQEGGHKHEYFDANGPLRGYKRDLYEGGIRVPMIARWPGKIRAGSVSNHAAAFWDFLPTACELAGVKPREDTDGISFLPELRGQHQRKHDYLFFAYQEKRAVRFGNWKAVRPGKNKPLELYNLAIDVSESNDVSDLHPEIVKQAKELIGRAAN
jgi:arylsulfatase A-like enzyme